jgi:hypothetical protein
MFMRGGLDTKAWTLSGENTAKPPNARRDAKIAVSSSAFMAIPIQSRAASFRNAELDTGTDRESGTIVRAPPAKIEYFYLAQTRAFRRLDSRVISKVRTRIHFGSNATDSLPCGMRVTSAGEDVQKLNRSNTCDSTVNAWVPRLIA